MEQHAAISRILKLGVDPGKSFFLHVGGNQWYKNRLGVLRTFSNLQKRTERRAFKLVMVGKPWTDEMRKFILENGIRDSVLELIGVADEDLRALYSTAIMLLFPSLQEGFGWPIVEAQACGCPVATSNRAPMNEVAGDAAIYIDPEDPSSAAEVLNDALDKLADIREWSLQNAERFKSGMVDSYISVYRKVCSETPVRHRVHQTAGNILQL
jgi:glycosyltransferase involved in cell wall biosynthesis